MRPRVDRMGLVPPLPGSSTRLRGRVWPGRGVPRWFRRQLERQYRARVRHILAVARYDDARYELLPVTRRKDAAWLFW
jgi:hypothetical protein